MGDGEREGGREWATDRVREVGSGRRKSVREVGRGRRRGGEGGREWATESGREVGSGRRRRGER